MAEQALVRLLTYEDLHRELLPRTIAHAMESCPYYKDEFGRRSINPWEITSMEALRKVPFLHPDTLRYQSTGLLDQTHRGPVLVRWTSGTSQSALARKYIFYSQEEAVRSSLAGMLLAKLGRAAEEGGQQRLGLYLQSGSLLGNPPTMDGYTLFAHAFDKDSPVYHDLIADMLTRRWQLPGHEDRISSLIINGRFELIHITNGLFDRGIHPAETAVRFITSIGDYLIPERRQWLESVWNARILNTYSMTEAGAPVVDCPAGTNVKHFDASLVAEAVDPDTLEPVPDGQEGVLVITCLYPFRQLQPLIRYWTADIVTLHTGSCSCGFNGTTMTEWHGRTDFSLNLNREPPPGVAPRHLGTAVLMKAISRLYPGFSFNQDMALSKLVTEDGIIQIQIELTRTTHLEHIPASGRCTPEAVEAELRHELPGWEPLLASGRIRFQVTVEDSGQP